MNRIDRLLIQARAAARPDLKLSVAILERNGHSWTSHAHLWDGKHPALLKRATYATLAAAVEYIRTLADEYHYSRDAVIIIDDM